MRIIPKRIVVDALRHYITGGLIFMSFCSFSQKRIQFTVYEVSTTIGDCDGLFGSSDPTSWWTGPGAVDDECYQTVCNGCIRSISTSIMDESYDCVGDVPSSIDVTFNGCEDDGPTGCVLGSAVSVICDGPSGSRTNTLPTQTTNGTCNYPQQCVTVGSGCTGQYCYK